MDVTQTSAADTDLEIVFEGSEFTISSVNCAEETEAPESREPDISVQVVAENGDEGQPEEMQDEEANLMEAELSPPAAVTVLSLANTNGLPEVIPNAVSPDVTITPVPVTKCVRKRRRKRFFSVNPANTVAYRTRTVTKAKLASKEAGSEQEKPKLTPAPVKNVQQKAKTLVDARNSNSSELPEGDARSSRKRSTTTKKQPPTQDQPDQNKRERFIDLDRPGSVLGQINIKSILSKHTFDMLPSLYQYKLLQLLPDVDTLFGSDNMSTPSPSAFNNEFFAKACEEWKTRLMAGEFTPEQIQKNRQEAERDKGKLDPWKVKYFEPVWGKKASTPANSKPPPKPSIGGSPLPNSKPSLESESPASLTAYQEEEKVPAVSQPVDGQTQDLLHPGKPPEAENKLTLGNSEPDSLISPTRSNKRIHGSVSREDQLQDKRGRLSVEPQIDTPEVLKSEPVAMQGHRGLHLENASSPLKVKSVEDHVESEPHQDTTTTVKMEDAPADVEEVVVVTNLVRRRNASKQSPVKNGVPLQPSPQTGGTLQAKNILQEGQINASDVQSPSVGGWKNEDRSDQMTVTNINQPDASSDAPKHESIENPSCSQVLAGTATVNETKGDLECVPQAVNISPSAESRSEDSKIACLESTGSQDRIVIAASQSDGEVKVVHSATMASDQQASLLQASQAMGIHRKARPKAKQGKLTRTPSAPPGSVNLERSYQICQAVIQSSPNREQLQNQLVKPPPVLVNSKPEVSVSLAGFQQQFSLSMSTQQTLAQPQRRGSTPALVQATQLPPHVQLLRPHQKLILTHIAGSPPTKQLGVSGHPVMAHPQLAGPSGTQLQAGLSALPILKPVQSSSPVLLQSGVGPAKPILQSQQSHAPATSNAPAATVITSQQLAMLIQQQQRQGGPAVLQPLGARNAGLMANSVTTSRCDAVTVSHSQQQQSFTCGPGIAARSIGSLPPHIKIISSQYLHRVPTSAVSSLPKSAPSLHSLNQVVRIPIQRQGQGGKPSAAQGNLPIRAKIINSVGETLTIHRAPTSVQQLDYNSSANAMSNANGSKGLSQEFSQQGRDSPSSSQSVGFPSKVRVIRAVDKVGLIPQPNKNGAPASAQTNGTSAGSSLAEFVTSQLVASNIRPISPLGVEHKQNVSFLSTGVRSNSPCPRNDQIQALGANQTQQTARPQTNNNNGGGLGEQVQGALLQGFSSSDELGLVSSWVGVNGEQELDLGAALDSPYSFISEAELGSVAETVDVSTNSAAEGGSSALSNSSKQQQQQLNTVYFAGSGGWDGSSCLTSSGGSSSDPIVFVSPSYELGGYVAQKPPFPPPASFPKSRMSLTPADALGKADLDRKGGGGNQQGQAASTSRFESPSASQAQPEGLRQQYIIVQATGSNGLPTNLAVPTNSLLLSSPMLIDQNRDLKNDNANAVAGMQPQQPGNFSIGLDGSNCETVTVTGLPTPNHLQGGPNNTACPTSLQSQLGMDVKVIYASTASGDGSGLSFVQTSAPSQGQFILNSFVNQAVAGPAHTFKTTPSNSSALKGSSLSTQLQCHPSAQAITVMSSGQNIIHVQSPALLGQQIGNRIVNVGMKAQSTWNSGVVNIMNASGADVVAQGGQQQQLQHLNLMEGPNAPLNVKVIQMGGNGKVVTSGGMDRLTILPKPSARGDCPAPRLEHIVLDKKGNCICDLRAMVMCRKCGVFCHDDCMGATNLCMTCTIR